MRQALTMMMAAVFAAATATAQDPANPGSSTTARGTNAVRGEAAQDPAAPKTTTTTTIRGDANAEPKGAFSDALFVAAAAAAGMAEVGSSKIAVQQAGSDEIKMFAQKMVDDHTKANKELMALASQKQFQVPTGISIQDQAAANALSGLSGEEFDCAYAKNQLAAHICAVELFTAEAERGRDPEVRAWAAKTLPTLKEHKMMIKKTCEMHEKKEAEKSAK